jgi:hypothetical protein
MRLHQSLMHRQIQLDVEKADKYQAKTIYYMLKQQVFQKQNAVKHLQVGASKLMVGLSDWQLEELASLEKSIIKDSAYYADRINECLESLKTLEQDLVALTAKMLGINPTSK